MNTVVEFPDRKDVESRYTASAVVALLLLGPTSIFHFADLLTHSLERSRPEIVRSFTL